MNWAYVRWLASPVATTDEAVELVNSWMELDAYRRLVRGRMRTYLDSLHDDELSAQREMNVDGEKTLKEKLKIKKGKMKRPSGNGD